MDVTRRDFLTLIAVAGGLGALTPRALAQQLEPERLLDFQDLGNVTLLHMTDAHATLNPVYYREPDTLIGVGDEASKPPFLTGEALLRAYGIRRGTAEAYALSHLDFEALAARYGRMGGYAHLATLVKRVRDARPGRTLLLDGGDEPFELAEQDWLSEELPAVDLHPSEIHSAFDGRFEFQRLVEHFRTVDEHHDRFRRHVLADIEIQLPDLALERGRYFRRPV